jgi:hypothetical protein
MCVEVLKEAQGALISVAANAQEPLINVTAKARADAAYDSAWDCLRRDIPSDAVSHVLTAKNAMTALKSLTGPIPGLKLQDSTILEPYGRDVRQAIAAVEAPQKIKSAT